MDVVAPASIHGGIGAGAQTLGKPKGERVFHEKLYWHEPKDREDFV